MLCSCGCGITTPVARRNRAELGHVKGEHVRFVRGHRPGIAVGFDVEDRGYETPCHVARGTGPNGYVRVKRDGRKVLAHVVAWEAQYGPLPEGVELDHLCRVRRCVNVEHLEPVTHAENCRRGSATKLTAAQAAEIRASVGVARDVGAAFGVSRYTVAAIRQGRRWVAA